MSPPDSPRQRWPFIVGAIVVLAVGGFFAVNAWLSSSDAPEAFVPTEQLGSTSRPTSGSDPGTATGSSRTTSTSVIDDARALDGTWSVALPASGEFGAGYRILEDVPVGGPETVVGRTEQVTGTLTIENGSLTATELTIDMASLSSGNELRDGLLVGGYFQTEDHPTAVFAQSAPLDLTPLPDEATTAGYEVGGDFTIRGLTLPKTVPVDAQWAGDVIEVVGSVDVTLAEFEVPRPDIFGRSAHEDAIIEFKLRFERSGGA